MLYGVISRYSIRSGNTSHRATLIDVFGSSNYTVSLELQPGIRRIISNLPMGTTLTEEQFIFQNTMFLFYTAFKGEEQSRWIWDEMLSEHGKDLYNATGQSTSPIKMATHFQYCIQCNRNSLEKHGEMYWRRLFQIPGVKICVEHGVWLSQSEVPMRGITKHTLTVPTQENCSEIIVEEVSDTKMLAQYRCIVNDVEKILNCEYPSRPLEWFYRCYKNQLTSKGYVSIKGRVDQKRVREDFVDYFGVELLDILQSSVVGNHNWLKSIFQKHRKGKEFHPIRHLLVIHFLGLSIEDVFYADESKFPFKPEVLADQPKRKILKKTMTPKYREQAKKERRVSWTEMRSQHPQLGRLELRKLNSRVYAWLYLYDREFLMEHMPDRLPAKSVTIRYDWQKRDEETLQKVRLIVGQLLRVEGKSHRITIARIHEALEEQCLYAEHLSKMPSTKEYLSQVLESTEKFRERSILWAIQELKKTNEPLILNRIKIKAGVGGVNSILLKYPELLQ